MPFACTYCDFLAPRKSSLKRHCLRAHQMTDNDFKTNVEPLYVGILSWTLSLNMFVTKSDVNKKKKLLLLHVFCINVSWFLCTRTSCFLIQSIFCDPFLQDCWQQPPSHLRQTANIGSVLLYPCSYCPKSFKTSQDLLRHERIHTGEMPFACIHCDFVAPIKSNLKRHCKRVHHMSDEEFKTQVGALYVGIMSWYWWVGKICKCISPELESLSFVSLLVQSAVYLDCNFFLTGLLASVSISPASIFWF